MISCGWISYPSTGDSFSRPLPTGGRVSRGRRERGILERGDFDYELSWRLSGNPFLTPAGTLVDAARQAIAEITGTETELSTSGGTSDGRFIAPMGCQVLELGPVNTTIHQANECVGVDELDQLSAIYERILSKLLGLAQTEA